MKNRFTIRASRGLALAAVVGLASGCAHVGQDEFDARMSDLRADLSGQIEEGDRALAQRMDQMDDRMDALRADLDALEQEFDVTVQELETALRFDVPVYFGFDEATVADRGREALARFSQVAQEYYPDAQITVEGFTDPSGSAEYNRRLGMRRAEAVRAHLLDHGLPEGRVRAVSYGEDTSRLIVPDASGPGQAGWQNRRVVLVIDHAGSPPALVSEDGAT